MGPIYQSIGKEVCDLISSVSCESGEVTYKSPCDGQTCMYIICVHSNIVIIIIMFIGANFSIIILLRCGCYASQTDHRACMACVAVNGYHSKATYDWLRNGESMFEKTPLLYTDREGNYECQVTSAGENSSVVFRIDRMFLFLFFHPSTGYKESFIHNH